MKSRKPTHPHLLNRTQQLFVRNSAALWVVQLSLRSGFRFLSLGGRILGMACCVVLCRRFLYETWVRFTCECSEKCGRYVSRPLCVVSVVVLCVILIINWCCCCCCFNNNFNSSSSSVRVVSVVPVLCLLFSICTCSFMMKQTLFSVVVVFHLVKVCCVCVCVVFFCCFCKVGELLSNFMCRLVAVTAACVSFLVFV